MPQDTRINNSCSNEAQQQSKIYRRAQSSMRIRADAVWKFNCSYKQQPAVE